MRINSLVQKNKFFKRLLIILGFISFNLIRMLIKKNKNSNVLIVALHRLGDTVLTIPAIKLLIDHYKNQQTYLLVFKGMEPLFNGIIEKNKLVVIDPKEFFLGNRLSKNNGRKLIKQIEPNTVIDLSGNMASASLIFTSGAVKIIGLRSEHSLPLIYELYDMSTKIRREPHLMDMYLDVVELIKPISRDHTHYEFPIKSTDSNIALIHPNAGWKAKEWGIDNFLELGKKLKSHFDVRFISENCFHPLIEEKLKNEGFGIIITKNLNDLILHINDAFILISNDTGPVHVAAFLGIPTFTIFGPTNPDFCKPIGSRHFAFQKKIECSPVYENYCNKYGGYYCEHNKCMTSISNEDVYHSILNFIDCIRKF